MEIKIKSIVSSMLGLVACVATSPALANSNPCSVDCVRAIIAEFPAISTFTGASWSAACPTGVAGLNQGCFVNPAKAAVSPLAALINIAYPMFNAYPAPAKSGIYLRRFPPGYKFTHYGTEYPYPNNTAVYYDASSLPSTTRVICDVFLENGTQPDWAINNDPTASDGVYNVFYDPVDPFFGGDTATQSVLYYDPTLGTATPLAVPLYAMCIGLSTVTNLPVSLEGFSAS